MLKVPLFIELSHGTMQNLHFSSSLWRSSAVACRALEVLLDPCLNVCLFAFAKLPH